MSFESQKDTTAAKVSFWSSFHSSDIHYAISLLPCTLPPFFLSTSISLLCLFSNFSDVLCVFESPVEESGVGPPKGRLRPEEWEERRTPAEYANPKIKKKKDKPIRISCVVHSKFFQKGEYGDLRDFAMLAPYTFREAIIGQGRAKHYHRNTAPVHRENKAIQKKKQYEIKEQKAVLLSAEDSGDASNMKNFGLMFFKNRWGRGQPDIGAINLGDENYDPDSDKKPRAGQILWIRGLTRLQTQVTIPISLSTSFSLFHSLIISILSSLYLFYDSLFLSVYLYHFSSIRNNRHFKALIVRYFL